MAKKKCNHCSYHEGTSYSLWEIGDAFIQSFAVKEEVKGLKVVICPKCKTEWLRQDYGNRCDLDILDRDNVAQAHWLTHDERPSAAQIKALAEIGGLKGDTYGNGGHYIAVPCRVELKSGEVFEHCLVQLSQKAPSKDEDISYWLSDISKISASKDALSYAVRYATSMAQEITNSYAPTVIEDKKGHWEVLNWTNYFWGSGDCAGKDYKLAGAADSKSFPKVWPSPWSQDWPKGKQKEYDEDAEAGLDFEVINIYGEWTQEAEDKIVKQLNMPPR